MNAKVLDPASCRSVSLRKVACRLPHVLIAAYHNNTEHVFFYIFCYELYLIVSKELKVIFLLFCFIYMLWVTVTNR